MTRKSLALAVACSLFAVGHVARADDTAAAAAMFDRGLADMKAGKYETGCPALQESYRLESLPGVLFTTAECYKQWGKLATAQARYEDYLAAYARMTPSEQAKQKQRHELSKKAIDEIRPRVPKLTLVLPPSAPTDTVVKRDGTVLGKPMLGVPIPTDAGDVVITTQVGDAPAHQMTIHVAEGDDKSVELEVVVAAPAATPVAGGAAQAPIDSSNPEADRHGSSRKTWGYVATGVGAAGIIVGSVAGVLALGKKQIVSDNCVDTRCNHEGKAAADAGRTDGLVSTIGFGVGIAGLVAGGWLLLGGQSDEAHASRGWHTIAAPSGKRGGYMLVETAW